MPTDLDYYNNLNLCRKISHCSFNLFPESSFFTSFEAHFSILEFGRCFWMMMMAVKASVCPILHQFKMHQNCRSKASAARGKLTMYSENLTRLVKYLYCPCAAHKSSTFSLRCPTTFLLCKLPPRPRRSRTGRTSLSFG